MMSTRGIWHRPPRPGLYQFAPGTGEPSAIDSQGSPAVHSTTYQASEPLSPGIMGHCGPGAPPAPEALGEGTTPPRARRRGRRKGRTSRLEVQDRGADPGARHLVTGIEVPHFEVSISRCQRPRHRDLVTGSHSKPVPSPHRPAAPVLSSVEVVRRGASVEVPVEVPDTS